MNQTKRIKSIHLGNMNYLGNTVIEWHFTVFLVMLQSRNRAVLNKKVVCENKDKKEPFSHHSL